MEYTVRKNKANRIAMRFTALVFLAIAAARLAMVIVTKEQMNLILTVILCVGGFTYGVYLMRQTLKVQAYDITYVFGNKKLTLKMHKKEKTISYAEITDLGYVVPNENMDYSLIQLYIGKEQYVLPFMGNSNAGKALYEMFKIKKQEAEADSIDEMRIREYLHTKWLANTIVYKRETDSTNIQAKRLGEEGTEDGIVVVTEVQTAGKGRRGRSWVSPSGNCYFSVLLRPDIRTEHSSMITLIAALGVVKAIRQVAKLDTMIKWPNDVIANGKKLCGILTESSTDLEYINYVVVGIGINTNQTEFPDEIKDKASSVRLEKGEKINRAELLAVFLNAFEEYYELFLKTEDLSALLNEYNSLLINRGKEVKIIEREEERVLKAIGIDKNGGLIVENHDGTQEIIISGEVTVRGLFGYV